MNIIKKITRLFKTDFRAENEGLVRAIQTEDAHDLVGLLNDFVMIGGDVNYRDDNGETLLMHVAKRFVFNENKDVFDVLLNNGANIYLRNKSGKTFVEINSELFKRRSGR